MAARLLLLLLAWPLLSEANVVKEDAGSAASSSSSSNQLIASYGVVPDPFHWFSFYSLPRTAAQAQCDGWSRANVSLPSAMSALPESAVSYWCRAGDYRVCLVYDAAGTVAGLQVSVSTKDFEQSFGSSLYPIQLESQWRRHTLLGTEVFSATAMFVPLSVLSGGGRTDFGNNNATVLDNTLHLLNGNSFWAMPANARDAVDVAYTNQGCVKGMGRHFFYNMSPTMACEEHRPFFLLFDDVSGDLQGFGVTLFGGASHPWFGRRWLEAPKHDVVRAMVPGAPPCFLDWTQKGLVALHVYFRPQPWRAECSKN